MLEMGRKEPMVKNTRLGSRLDGLLGGVTPVFLIRAQKY